MEKIVVILVIIFVVTITMTGCVTASVSGDDADISMCTEIEEESVYEDYAELSMCTDYKYAVVEADEGTGIAWEDLYIYEIQGYVRNDRGLTLILVDGTIRVEEGNEYFLCRTEADVDWLLSFLDKLNEQI